MKNEPTPAPWTWEVNESTRMVQLVSGRGLKDTVMDFVRWGMQRATPRFSENHILRLADEFSVIVPGREHHSHWYKTVEHPDARLIAAAPDLLAALLKAKQTIQDLHGDDEWEIYERCSPEMKLINAALDKAFPQHQSIIKL